MSKRLGSRSNVITVGVQCFVLSESRLLLGLRTGGFGAGTWGLPGGHLEQGETILQAAARELEEESGIRAGKLSIAAIGDPILENNYHLQIGVLVETWTGSPALTAPAEIGRWEFFPPDRLPSPLLVSSAYIIEKYTRGALY
jgi:8-oxo-dGTP diphosphatase